MTMKPPLLHLNTQNSHFIGALFFYCLSHNAYSIEANNSLDFSAAYIDNIGLASLEADQMSDFMLELEAVRAYRKTIGTSQALTYGANFNVRDYRDYPCDRTTFGLQLGYEKKLGIGFDKPRLSVLWKGSRNIYAVDSLNGYSSEFSLRLSKPINNRFDASLQLSKTWEIPDNSPNTFGLPDTSADTPSDALNQESVNLGVSAEYYANEHWSFPMSLSYLDGDLASIARLRPDNLFYADAVANDEGLGPDWFLFRSKGSAWSANFAASRLLKDGSLLNIELEYTDASVRGNMKYGRQSITVSWVKNW